MGGEKVKKRINWMIGYFKSFGQWNTKSYLFFIGLWVMCFIILYVFADRDGVGRLLFAIFYGLFCAFVPFAIQSFRNYVGGKSNEKL